MEDCCLCRPVLKLGCFGIRQLIFGFTHFLLVSKLNANKISIAEIKQ